MNDYKKLSDEKQKSPEVEYIAARLNSVMETYRKLVGKCA